MSTEAPAAAAFFATFFTARLARFKAVFNSAASRLFSSRSRSVSVATFSSNASVAVPAKSGRIFFFRPLNYTFPRTRYHTRSMSDLQLLSLFGRRGEDVPPLSHGRAVFAKSNAARFPNAPSPWPAAAIASLLS